MTLIYFQLEKSVEKLNFSCFYIILTGKYAQLQMDTWTWEKCIFFCMKIRRQEHRLQSKIKFILKLLYLYKHIKIVHGI